MTAVMSVEQAHRARYAQAREALWGKPKAVNLLLERRRADAAKSKARREELDRYMAGYLASRRALEELAKWCSTGFSVSGEAAAAPYTLSVVPAIIESVVHQPPRMEKIAKRVLKKFPGVSMEDVRGKSRSVYIMLARRHVIATIRILRPDISYTAIGQFVNKDHTSCLHAVRKYMEDQLKAAA